MQRGKAEDSPWKGLELRRVGAEEEQERLPCRPGTCLPCVGARVPRCLQALSGERVNQMQFSCDKMRDKVAGRPCFTEATADGRDPRALVSRGFSLLLGL